MTRPLEPAVRDDWQVLCRSADIAPGATLSLRLLAHDLTASRERAGSLPVVEAEHRALPVVEAYGHVFTSLGRPARPLFATPEVDEPDRRLVTCGGIGVRASGLRLVENFLDMAHFPFVHNHILGVVERPEVPRYACAIREKVDEVWATDCRFWQPLAAASAQEGQMSDYRYRVVSPFDVLLYKTSPADPTRDDVIGLLIRAVEPDLAVAYAFLSVIDAESAETTLIHFQQTIFLQDRIILENQRPRLLPLSPRAETPTRADLSSVVYRRWLKAKGVRFGVLEADG